MVSTPQESQGPQKVTDIDEKGNTNSAKRSVARYAAAGLVIVAAWALTVLSFAFEKGPLALPVFFVAVACVTCLVSPSGGPNAVANHGGIGILVAAAVAAPLLLAKAGFIFVGIGAILGGIIGMCVGVFRSETSLP